MRTITLLLLLSVGGLFAGDYRGQGFLVKYQISGAVITPEGIRHERQPDVSVFGEMPNGLRFEALNTHGLFPGGDTPLYDYRKIFFPGEEGRVDTVSVPLRTKQTLYTLDRVTSWSVRDVENGCTTPRETFVEDTQMLGVPVKHFVYYMGKEQNLKTDYFVWVDGGCVELAINTTAYTTDKLSGLRRIASEYNTVAYALLLGDPGPEWTDTQGFADRDLADAFRDLYRQKYGPDYEKKITVCQKNYINEVIPAELSDPVKAMKRREESKRKIPSQFRRYRTVTVDR